MNPVSKFTTPKIRRENSDPPSASDKKDAVQVFCRLRPLNDQAEETACIKLLSPTTLSLTTPPDSKISRKEIHSKFRHIFTAYSNQHEVFHNVAFPLLDDLLHGKNGLLFTYGVTGSGKTYTLAGDHNNPGIMPKCIYTIFNSVEDHQAPKYVIKSDRMNGFEVQSIEDAEIDQQQELRATNRTPARTPSARRVADKSYINDGAKLLNIDGNHLFSIFVSYVEIYNNYVYDLLDESQGRVLQNKIIREDNQKNMYVNNVMEVEVKSAEEAFNMFNLGQKRKKMGNTMLNAVSSRSHSIFTIRVVQLQQFDYSEGGTARIPDSNLLKVAQLSLVDLAGSERCGRTQCGGASLKEASQINNSLMSLRTCLELLRENQLTGSTKLIPYRDTRLTLLFKNYFEGQGKVVMIVCINPSQDDFEENLHVVKFAEMSQDVKVNRAEPRYTPAKRTIKKTEQTPIKIKPTGSFSFGPNFPDLNFDFKNLEATSALFDKLGCVFKTRQQRTVTLSQELSRNEDQFRSRLLKMQDEQILQQSELKSTKQQLKVERQRCDNVEAKLANKQSELWAMNAKVEELNEEIRKMRNVIAEKDSKISRNLFEKERTKQTLVLQKEKMSQELDAKLRRQREHLRAEARAKDHKLNQMRNILDDEAPPTELFEETEPEVVQKAHVEPPQTPTRSRKFVLSTSTPRRRSRSAGEIWLEHNSVKPVPLGTVMQPLIKKRKSVTKLSKASDVTNPKQSKYCLIAQEQDADGEIETKVYKGDIVATCGGGAQVILNDVEKLTQQSPTK